MLEAFRAYQWPGIVRELENVIKNAIAYSRDGRLTLADFPRLDEGRAEGRADAEPCRICLGTRFTELPRYGEVEESFKRAYFEEVLKRAGNNVAKAAAAAGLTPQGLRKIMNTLEIKKP